LAADEEAHSGHSIMGGGTLAVLWGRFF
jgi:hypothetical protein